jgi:hypothetical protein
MTTSRAERGSGSITVLGAVCLAALILPLSFSVSAILAALSAGSIHGLVENTGLPPLDNQREIAQRVATGDLADAARLAPEALRPLLAQSYVDAFQSLTHVLAVLTVLSASAVFFFLGRKPAVEAERTPELVG